jgi:hypothetical protein
MMFSLFRKKRWDSDPTQRDVANLLLKAAAEFDGVGMLSTPDQDEALNKIIGLATKHGWSGKEAAARVDHALSLIKRHRPFEEHEPAEFYARILSRTFKTGI